MQQVCVRAVIFVTVLQILGSAPIARAAISLPMGDQLFGNCGDTMHGPGCSDPGCQACVCADTPECCTDDWDDTCLFVAGEKCGAACFAVVGNCGIARPEPGCSDRLCETCVCTQFGPGTERCCTDGWFNFCAQAADGILFGDDTCAPACLIANRPRPAPTASVYGVIAALFAVGGIAWWRLRQRTA